MKRILLSIQLLLASATVTPITICAGSSFRPTTVAATANPISQAETFYSGDIVSSPSEGEYKWYKYKADKKSAYRLLIGYSTQAQIKMTTNPNTDVNRLNDVELTKDKKLWGQVTPPYVVNAGEYLYFGISSTSSFSVDIIQEEITYTYQFGDAAVSPADGSVINSLADVVITYPNATTNNTDTQIALTMSTDGASSTNGESLIPAQVYAGRLDAVHGHEAISTARIKLVTTEAGKAELHLASDQKIDPETWYTIQIPQNVLSFCTEMFFPGSGIFSPVQDSPATPGMLLHYCGRPTKLLLTGSGIATNDTIQHLGMIPFRFNAEVKAAEGAGMELRADSQLVKRVSLNVTNTDNGCIVWGNFADDSLAPYALKDSTAYTLVLPAKSVTSLDGTLANKEISVAFSGPIYKTDTVKVEVPTPVEAKMVSFTYTLGDQFTTVTATPKEKSLTVEITPEEGWKVATLTLNDLNVLPDLHETTYKSPVLYKDATLTATLAYEGVVFEEDQTTGIAHVDNTNLKAYSEGGKIIVEGLSKDDVVKVYSVGGSLLNQTTVAHNRVSISLPTNQVYIVKVGNHALKLRNK
ncbi:secreted protein [gut metagenome]|uniref:Secreted protein n=1 Tax=gut metagenome TaxID=749906 RepID=J9GMP9_9ZZZZ